MDKMGSFQDDFNDNRINTSEWTVFQGGSGTLLEQNRRIEMSLPAAATNADYAEIWSDSHSLIDSYAFMETISVPNQITTANAQLMVYHDDDNWVRFVLEENIIYFQRTKLGEQVTLSSLPFNSSVHKWWAIAESSGNVLFRTSPDGINWTTHESWTHGMNTQLSEVNAQISEFAYQNETNPGDFFVDNFNIVPNSGAFFHLL